MKKLYVSLAIACLFSAPAFAEQGANKGQGPQLDKFNGIGSMENFKAAMPSERHGWQLLREKNNEQAIAEFRSALKTYPHLPQAYFGMGIANERLNNLKDAEDAYRGAIKCDTSKWQYWKRLANLLYQQNRLDEARQALSDASALKPPKKAQEQIDKMIVAVEDARRNGHADRRIDSGDEY